MTIDPDPRAAWIAVNDVVMGGVSRGAATREPEGALVFAGTVSFEHGGGFASARRAVAGDALPPFDALSLRVQGDGKRYKLAAYTDAGTSGFAYQAAFETRAGETTVIVIPLASFEARFRGRPVGDAPPLASGQIRALGFVIADRQEGVFRLRVESIEATVAGR
jgi:NADH dehydrogenase [ubiquinone] 1 alpha subcomplex assembly factor 1